MAINPKRNFDEEVKPSKQTQVAEEVCIPEEPRWSLDEIILPQAVREKILDVANYSDNSHRVFELWGFKHTHKFSRRIGINLYGAARHRQNHGGSRDCQTVGRKNFIVNRMAR